jgi:hypothetical protein
MKGQVTVQDIQGRSAIVKISKLDPADTNALTKMQTFASALATFTNAAPRTYSVFGRQEAPVAAAPGKPETDSFVGDRAVCFFSYVDALQETKVIKLEIPGPEESLFEHDPTVGYRVTAANGETLAAMLRTATGISAIEFVNGLKEYREYRQ